MGKNTPTPKPILLLTALFALLTLPAAAQPERVELLPVNTCLAALDTMKAKNPYQWIAEVWNKEDSIFMEMQRPNRYLNRRDFTLLQNAVTGLTIPARELRAILPEWKAPDSLKGSVPVKCYAFDPPFNQYALVFGSTLGWSHQVFFFTGNQLVGVKEIFHKNGLEIRHFKNPQRETVVYIAQCIESGTGIWQYNWFFFKYQSGQIVPVLNVLKESNKFLPGESRSFAYESKFVAPSPFTLTADYEVLLPDLQSSPVRLRKMTENHAYTYSRENGELTRNKAAAALSAAQMTALHVYAREELFIHAFATHLKTALMEGNLRQKQAVQALVSAFVQAHPEQFSGGIKAANP
jgi:hypothetical protein